MERGEARSNTAPGLWVIAFGVLLGCAAFYWNAKVDESSFTQASGVRENATVTHVHTEQYYVQYGGVSDATDLTVALPTPVKGRTSTVVTLSYLANYSDGQVVAVLVNPRDPGHAELPGQADAVWWQPIVIGLGAVGVLGHGVARIMRTAGASPSGTKEKPPKTYEKPSKVYDEKLPQTYDDDPPEIYYYFRRI